MLGELEVLVAGEAVALPRSRKTRALLAYLAVTGRAHRRDHLADLLWDVADDRRGALRWSLSKLRKALGSAGARLLATREHIELVIDRDELDVATLRRVARDGLASGSIEMLEGLARGGRGELLEGLFLPDFDTFEAWLEAERAEARALYARISRALVERLAHEPARAFEHARAWLERTNAADARDWVERLSARLGESASPHRAAPRADAPAKSVRGASTPLFGRDAEVARLCLIANEARSQRSVRVILLVGEPGMGKTRLLDELRHDLSDPPPSVLHAVFHQAERSRPLGPFIDATRGALPIGQPAGSDSPIHEREQLLEALAGLIRRGADERGLGLLLLDDAHLCDPSSCELLHYVVRTSARFPLVTVLACRPAELEDNEDLTLALSALRRRHVVLEMRLRPLDPAAMLKLVAAQAPNASAERVVDESAGNPLLAIELAHAGDTTSAMPRTLSDLVLARLASLPEDTRALVRWAAVVERGPVAALEAACAGEVRGIVDALENATRYRLVHFGQGSFEMEHALIQRVVYDSISPVRRAAMHQRVAEVSSEGPLAAERASVVAYHAGRANRLDLAARALIRGAERCVTMGAAREAAALADRALAVAPQLDPETALEIELDALLALAQVRRPDDPASFVARLTELGLAALERGRAEEARRAFNSASHLRWDAGSPADGYGLARRALVASREGDADQRVRGTSLVALCCALMETQLPEARSLVQEAEALSRAKGQGAEPAELALARALLHFHAGRLDEARRDAEDARTLARVEKSLLREAAALELTAQLELGAGQKRAAAAAGRALCEIASRIREGGEGTLGAAVVALSRDRIDDARADFCDAISRLQALDDKRRLAWVANRAARWERVEGDPGGARRLAALALDAARAVEAFSESAIAAAELMAAAGDDDDAYGEAEETLARLEASGALSHEARRWIDDATTTSPTTNSERG